MEAKGFVSEIDYKTTATGKNYFVILLDDGNKYSKFSAVPDEIKFAEEKGKPISIEYVLDKTGKFRNIVSMKPLDSLGGQSSLDDVVIEETVVGIGYARENRITCLIECITDAKEAAMAVDGYLALPLDANDKKLIQKLAAMLYIEAGKNKR